MHIQPLSCNIYLPVWASVITRQSRPEQKVVFLALDLFRFDHLLSVCLLTGIQYYRKSYKTTARRHFPSWKCSSPTEESRHEENNKCYLITKQQGVWNLCALLSSNWRRTRCPPTAQPWEQEVEPNRKQEEGNEWRKKRGKLGGMGRTDWEQLKWLVTLVWFTPQYPAAEDKIQVCVEMARIREAELIALSPSSSHRCWNCVRKIAADGLTSCFFGKLPVEQRVSVGRRSGWMMQAVHKTLNWLLLWPVKHIYWPSCPGGQ